MKKKILLADDDPAIVEATSMFLEEYGYEVKTTCDGKTIYKMEKEMPDVLLLDIWMSGEDGREIAKYLKNKNDTKHIPIVMISASHNIKESAKEAGADDFLEKPFKIEDLIFKIEKVLRNKN